MGVLIDRNIDKELFDKAVNETHSILHSAEQQQLQKTERNIYIPNKKEPINKQIKYSKVFRGYCIRCQNRIDFDPNRPYCGDCYSIWIQFENPDYQENVCHRCGEFEPTSMNRPLDYKCYTQWQKELTKNF
jgi:hypothetical protein